MNVQELCADLDRYARDGVLCAHTAADLLRRRIASGIDLDPELCAGETDGYSARLLHATPACSVLALTWLPGQMTPIHDHISWCVVGVLAGAELDESFQLWRIGGRRVLVPAGQTTSTAGRVTVLEPPDEDIHRVSNPGRVPAVSLHIYGADIRHNGNSSINRVFGEPIAAEPPPGARQIHWRTERRAA
ncbi:cysteine dioxygenase family protein [Longispora albida]|uniref:cysteine dioxygenase family protein n=1 Tax=Longispora albida TaxID=203523 RepID=UPI00036554B2|nr:cysteine dioxygenase family protein [Longispora albida]